MKAKPLFFFVIFLVALFIFFKIDRTLSEGVLFLGNKVKGKVLDFQEWITETYRLHFDQARLLQSLLYQEKEIERLRLSNIQLQAEFDLLRKFYDIPSPPLTHIYPTRMISYKEFGNYFRIWLEEYSQTRDGFFGLIVGGHVAGIAKKDEDQRMVGYLNGDPLCSYGVYIGKNQAPGIIRSQGNVLIADFIPLRSKIEIGDEVVTNGLDEIFFPNIPVGKITKINEENGYLNAEIAPYAHQTDLGYMWLLDRRRND